MMEFEHCKCRIIFLLLFCLSLILCWRRHAECVCVRALSVDHMQAARS